MSDVNQDPQDEGFVNEIKHEIKDDSELLAKALGGWAGVIDSGLPFMVFTIAYLFPDRNLQVTLYAALGTAAILAVLRLARRQSLQQVLAGLFGIAIAAFLASRTGNADDFFLPGILTNAAYTAACLVSILAKRPLLGYVLEAMRGNDMSWVKDSKKHKLFSTITWLWTLMFGIRVAIMLPLYFLGQTAALGTLKILLGYPLFALSILMTYRLLTRDKLLSGENS